MYPKQIAFKEAAREKLLAGVNTLFQAVVTTLGPGGRNVFIDTGQGTSIITKDGVTVARHVNVLDEIENMAIQVIKESAAKLLEKDGDGTTTVTALTCSIINECFARLKADPSINVTQMALGIEDASKAVVEEINKLRIECTPELLRSVCAVSSNHNPEVYTHVAQAFDLAGDDGTVVASLGRNPKTVVQKILGYKLNAGFSDQVFASLSSGDSGTIRWENVHVILCADSIGYARNIIPIVGKILDAHGGAQGGPKPKILLISRGLTGEAKAFVLQNVAQGSLDLVHIQAPYFLTDMQSALEDIASITGATVIGEERYGSSIENAVLENVGFLRSIEIRSNVSLLKTERRNPEYINKLNQELASAIEDNLSERVTFLRQRIQMLEGQLVSIEIGGEIAIDQLERNDLFDDAIRACESARKHGVVPGGSVSLVKAMYKAAKPFGGRGKSYQIGYQTMLDCCLIPITYIFKNMGLDTREFKEGDQVDMLMRCLAGAELPGLDFRPEYYHFHDDELVVTAMPTIYDPINVVTNCVKFSAIVAKSIVTTDCTINMIRVNNQ